MSELEYVNKIAGILNPYFHVSLEVKSNCRNGRIDMLLIDRKNKDVYFGIEVKRFERKRGEEIAKFIDQAIRYTDYTWPVNGVFVKIPIMICPSISYNYLIMRDDMIISNGKEYFSDRHDKYNTHHTINGLLGYFNIGEVRKVKYSFGEFFRFCFSNKVVWTNTRYVSDSTYKGVDIDKYLHLISKL